MPKGLFVPHRQSCNMPKGEFGNQMVKRIIIAVIIGKMKMSPVMDGYEKIVTFLLMEL